MRIRRLGLAIAGGTTGAATGGTTGAATGAAPVPRPRNHKPASPATGNNNQPNQFGKESAGGVTGSAVGALATGALAAGLLVSAATVFSSQNSVETIAPSFA